MRITHLILNGFFSLFLLPTVAFASVDNAFLLKTPSPYLQRHSDDQVQWQLLTQQTLQVAQKQEKLILLSSGYSSCYWCYRMKEDSFKDREVGQLINQHFNAFIVDRELEPELDAYLQQFMQQLRGFGGWPVTVILSPDLIPIAGFNYSPADAFSDTLNRLLNDWQQQPAAMLEKAKQRQTQLTQQQQQQSQVLLDNVPVGDLLLALLSQVQAASDQEYGGFGRQEKFPHAPQLQALLDLYKTNPNKELLSFLQTSLSAMLGGGLRDHVGGGFFRYTSDKRWTYPHYEQMLYTQALLGMLLLDMGETFKQPVFTQAGLQTLQAMRQQFQRDDGLFMASLAATGVDGKAGSYYLWQDKDLEAALGQAPDQLVYNLLGKESKAVLPFLLKQDDETRQALLKVRQQRPLERDQKALTAWNGLALSALAKSAKYSDDLKQAGKTLLEAILPPLSASSLHRLLDDDTSGEASLADYVFLARGLIDWAAVDGDKALVKQGVALLDKAYQQFYGDNGWLQARHKPLIGDIRAYAIADTELPSESAVWLSTVWQVQTNHPDLISETLLKQMQQVAAKQPKALKEQAFFHASLISGMVLKKLD